MDVDRTANKVVHLPGHEEAVAHEAIDGITQPKDKGTRNRLLTDILVDLGFASREKIDEAIEETRSEPSLTTKQVLIDKGIITPDQLSKAIAERFGLDYIDLNVFKINVAALNLINIETARRYRAVPVEFLDDHTIQIAMTDPSNVLALDDLGILTRHQVRPVVASPADIEAVIAQMSKFDDSIEEAILEDEAEPEEITDIHESADNAPIIRLTGAIISQAIQARASDIHLDPGEEGMQVRYRVDGVLADANRLPKGMIAGVTSRIKVMAELDIAEHRRPQDGRVSLKVDGRPVDLRVVTLPSSHGESVIMRILDKEQTVLRLETLGLEGDALSRFESAVGKPYGATLVTGPTGSGKTTTLYAGIQLINTRDKSILTVEDPVEYQIDGVTQIQVNEKAGLGFSTGLRSMLRADPDVIMVGEIRDKETARIAVEAALTGHLVLSTLHTNNAPAAITRLIDMSIEPFLLASALDCVVAQRLARKLCSSCKQAIEIDVKVLRSNGFHAESPLPAFRAGACTHCNGTGYRGRIGIFEVMVMNDRIRQLTMKRSSVDELREEAIANGMQLLIDDGLKKVEAGMTSMEEVLRIVT